MVGIGTSEVNLDQFRHSFCSMLGTDEDSWGLSYTGEVRGHVTLNRFTLLWNRIIVDFTHLTCIHCGLGQLHHKGSKVNFSSRFGQGSIIGVHLDTWHGTLSFYKNRRCIGKTQNIKSA